MADAPENQVGYLLVRIAHVLRYRWTRDLKLYGVTAAQHSTLVVLNGNPDITGGQLARAALVTPQAVSELLDGLQRRGLVHREPPVARGHRGRTRLTPTRQQVLEQTAEVIEASNSPSVLGLTAGEASTLHDLLLKVLAATSEA